MFGFNFIREDLLLNDAFAEGRVGNTITHIKRLVRGIAFDRFGARIQLLHPLHFYGNGLFYCFLSGGASRGSRRSSGWSHRAGFSDPFLWLIIVFTLTRPANDPCGHSPHHRNDGMAEIHSATGAIAHEFFSNGQRCTRSIHAITDRIA